MLERWHFFGGYRAPNRAHGNSFSVSNVDSLPSDAHACLDPDDALLFSPFLFIFIIFI